MQTGKGVSTKKLAADVVKLRKEIGPTVRARMAELSRNGDWFSELCFCILTANYTAEGGLRLQEAAEGEGGFCNIPDSKLEPFLRRHGHRFPKVRSSFIALAKKHKCRLTPTLRKMPSSAERRGWLVQNVVGLGMKEASHFLRNVGFFDVAIIDRHVLKVLAEYGIINKIPKSLSRKQYLETEQKLAQVAKLAKMSLGELDFYLWFMKTGKVVKSGARPPIPPLAGPYSPAVEIPGLLGARAMSSMRLLPHSSLESSGGGPACERILVRFQR